MTEEREDALRRLMQATNEDTNQSRRYSLAGMSQRREPRRLLEGSNPP